MKSTIYFVEDDENVNQLIDVCFPIPSPPRDAVW